jgi:VWFA-related protein
MKPSVPYLKERESEMFNRRHTHKKRCLFFAMIAIALVGVATGIPTWAKDHPATPPVPVKMLVTVQGAHGKKMPDLKREDIVVKQGNERFNVTQWTPATGEDGSLAFYILIDDAADTSLGGLLDDVRAFIEAQPATTLVGVGYMSNATVRIAQDLTNDHGKASQALRLPLGNPGAYGSPYLSLADLVKRWPDHPGRKEVLMITDGIDRFRGQYSRLSALSPSPDLDTASSVCQRAGIIVHSIYARGTGRRSRNIWILTGGQYGLGQLADETGGEAFFLGYENPVSFKPHLDQLQAILDNQYWLGFETKPGKKAELRSVDIDTEISGVDIHSADGVHVPAAQ